MEIRTQHIKGVLSVLLENSPALEEELNAADAKLGDGDTGAMLSRFIGALNQCEIDPDSDLGMCFMALAQAGSASTGSSFGTLLMTGLMSLAKGTRGENEIHHNKLGKLMRDACDVMLARGQSNLGDKTAIDAISAVAGTLAETTDDMMIGDLQSTLDKTMNYFRNEPCKMGRARMFAEKSIGLDDPGMLAIMRITEIITDR